MRPLIAPLLAALLLSACTDVREVQRAVDEVDSEVTTHCQIIDRSGSLSGAHSELDRHAGAVDDDLRRLRARLDDLDDVCETDRRGVWDAVFDVDARIDVYLSQAGDMSDVATWRALCDDYSGDVGAELASLRRRLDDLPCW